MIKIVTLLTLLFAANFWGCKQQQHKKEENLLKKEGQEADKSASDLSMAVKVTDEAGWDGKDIYMQFKAKVLPLLNKDSSELVMFKAKVAGKRKRIPLFYRSKVSGLEKRITELKNRVENYKPGNKAGWEDFETLFNDDLKRMELALQALVRK